MKKHKVKGIEVDYPEPDFPYGIDVADEMTKILSEQLAREIDKNILKSLGIEPDRNKRRKNSIKKIFNEGNNS
jgi:hypothetical protein